MIVLFDREGQRYAPTTGAKLRQAPVAEVLANVLAGALPDVLAGVPPAAPSSLAGVPGSELVACAAMRSPRCLTETAKLAQTAAGPVGMDTPVPAAPGADAIDPASRGTVELAAPVRVGPVACSQERQRPRPRLIWATAVSVTSPQCKVSQSRRLPIRRPWNRRAWIVYVLRGTANFHVGHDVHRLTGGSLLVIPPHVTHCIAVQGDEEVPELDAFTPKRPAYGG
jgi:hypothetical protein